MGLRCSLLGHRWDDPRVEQEREETDAEAVTTVREFRECARCGAREVLSENVEVTARDPDGVVVEDAETGERTVVDADDAGKARPDDGDGGGHGDATPDDGDGGAGEDAEDGGAVILDQPDDREYGEWPDDDDVGPPDGVERDPWPDPDDERAGDAPADAAGEGPPGDDTAARTGRPVEEGGDGAVGEADVEDRSRPDDARDDEADADGDGGGERDPDRAAPDEERAVADPEVGVAETHEPAEPEPVREPADGEEEDVELLGGGGSTPDQGGGPAGGGASEPPAEPPADDGTTGRPERAGGPATPRVEDGDVELFCPNCGYVADESETSLRGGDSCPSCRGSYLDERPGGR